jgi:OOP family OmpA-OmpF porin
MLNIKQALTPFYEVKPYDKAAMAAAIDKLPSEPSGTTPLQKGLEELEPILLGLKGHTVVFVMTDGTFSDWETLDKPIVIAKKLASKYDVSFFVIDISGKPDNPQLKQAVSSINARSRVINFDEFLENPLFLSGALFIIEKSIVKKSVDVEKVIGAKLDHLLFAHDSAEIDPKYADKLNKLGEYLQKNPTARLALSAFTDNNGPTEYNLDLSKRRVESIASYLEKNFKVARERMALNFYGEANPVADNKTDDGRAKNRRIEGFVWL